MHSSCTSKRDLPQRDIVSDFARPRRQSVALQDILCAFLVLTLALLPALTNLSVESLLTLCELYYRVESWNAKDLLTSLRLPIDRPRKRRLLNPSPFESSCMEHDPSCLLLFNKDPFLFFLLLNRFSTELYAKKNAEYASNQVNLS